MVMDTVIATSAARDSAENWREFAEFGDYQTYEELSLTEYLAFGCAMWLPMLPYLKAKLESLDRERAELVAGYCLVVLLRNRRWDSSRIHDFVRFLVPHIAWTRSVELRYDLRDDDENYLPYREACPIWKHVRLALADMYCCSRTESETAHDAREILSVRCDYDFARCIDNENRVEGIYYVEHGWPALHFETCEALPTTTKYDVIKVIIPFKTRGFGSLHFQQWSPRGLARFLPIDPDTACALAQMLKDGPYGMKDHLRDHVVTFLNNIVEKLVPAEIGKIVAGDENRYHHGHLIFSEAKFRLVSEEEYSQWADEVKTRIYIQIPEDEPEHDDVCHAIVKELRKIWWDSEDSWDTEDGEDGEDGE